MRNIPPAVMQAIIKAKHHTIKHRYYSGVVYEWLDQVLGSDSDVFSDPELSQCLCDVMDDGDSNVHHLITLIEKRLKDVKKEV